MVNKKLVLFGGGGHCKSVLDAVIRCGEYDEIVITDPEIDQGSEILGCKVVGADDLLPELIMNGFKYAFITVGSIGDSGIRKKLTNLAFHIGYSFPIIVDPSAQIAQSAQIGCGTFVGKNAVLNAGSSIGSHCIINTGAIIEHGCRVDDYSHISVGAILCGECKVGTKSFIGAGTTVIHGGVIGDNALVGLNSTVLTDVEDNMKVYGVVK